MTRPVPLRLPPLMEPGTAEVSGDGVLHLAGSDLDWADLGGATSVRVNAARKTLSLRCAHSGGRDHKIIPAGPRGLIPARRELRALGVRQNVGNDPITVRAVRHSDGHTRWLELRFPPEAMKARAGKNKSTSPQRRQERRGATHHA